MNGDLPRAAIRQLLQNPGGLYSQSNNFLGVVQSAVDPRTGQFNLAITLPTLHANDLSGPSFALTLAFSPLSSLQNNGFGLGWSPLVSTLTLNLDRAFLTLSSGEQFAVDRDATDTSIGSELVFADHKLKSLKVTKLTDDSYRLDSKSGDVEILERLAGKGDFLLREMRSPEGRALFFEWLPYDNGGHLLRRVYDTSRNLLDITREGTSRVHFKFYADSESPSTIELWLLNRQLSNVKLPGIDSTFQFDYELIDLGAGDPFLFPTLLTGPLGATDTISWSSQASGHQLPEGAPLAYVPRVVTWSQRPGDPQATLYHHYKWIGNANHYGFGSGAGFEWESGRDNLYKVHKDYQYSVVETLRDHMEATLVTITRQWNRFHLQTLETSVRGKAQVQVKTVYHVNPGLSWEAQPAYCQLPHIVTTTYYQDANNQRSEDIEYRYDDYGNVIYTRFPSGVVEESLYYPAAGCDECPEDPLGMVRFISKKTTIPAPSSFDAPTHCITYCYENLASLDPQDPPRAVVVGEQAWNETEGLLLESTLQTYVQDNGPDYGRIATADTTINGLCTTTRYVYTTETDRLRTEMIVEGHDLVIADLVSRSSNSDSRSLLTGQTLEERSTAGVITAYTYDLLGRVIKTVIAKGSGYEVERKCDYHLSDSFIKANCPETLVAQVGLEETDASGQRRRSWMDGKGRVVSVELEDLVNAEDLGNAEDLVNAEATFREISRSTFDPLGRVSTQTRLEWLADGTKAFETCAVTCYDDWGNAAAVTSPTGVVSHTSSDPIAMRTEQWLQGAGGGLTGKQVTLSNVAGSPVRQEFYDDQGELVRSVVLLRDGLERLAEQCVEIKGKTDIVTSYHYDGYSRLIEQVQPDGTRIQWTYAPHSDGEHPESVKVIEASL